ncbi:hypothetical protein KCA24_33845, partial [Escherichia coli]|nr:hypothetical protein [Escherichia coli]
RGPVGGGEPGGRLNRSRQSFAGSQPNLFDPPFSSLCSIKVDGYVLTKVLARINSSRQINKIYISFASASE